MMTNIHRGDIYLADLDPVRGSEQGGIRPVLVLSNNCGNRHAPTVVIAPLTGQRKSPLPTHVPIRLAALSQESTALLEQIRTLDKSRLLDRIGTLSYAQMQEVNAAIDISLGKKRSGGKR